MVGQEELEVLLNKMFEVAGYEVTYSEIVTRKDKWYNDFIMTGKQQEEWMKWGKKYLEM
jgi:DNA polymerase sigma